MPSPTGYTRSPRLQPGALIQLRREIVGVYPSITLFQYNPESITHSFTIPQPRDETEGLVSHTESAFPPGESYTFKLELDATDDLEKGRLLAKTVGIADRLAVLERLAFSQGAIPGPVEEVAPTLCDGPLTRASRQTIPIILLALGRRRVLPVRIDSLSVDETAHSPDFMPIHASVSLSFSVLLPHKLPKFSLAGLREPETALARAAYYLYRAEREALALAHIVTVVQEVGDYVR